MLEEGLDLDILMLSGKREDALGVDFLILDRSLVQNFLLTTCSFLRLYCCQWLPFSPSFTHDRLLLHILLLDTLTLGLHELNLLLIQLLPSCLLLLQHESPPARRC